MANKKRVNVKNYSLEERRAMRDLLPYGWITQLAKTAKVSKQCVCKFWNGGNSNVFVIHALGEMLKRLEGEKDGITESVNNISEQKVK